MCAVCLFIPSHLISRFWYKENYNDWKLQTVCARHRRRVPHPSKTRRKIRTMATAGVHAVSSGDSWLQRFNMCFHYFFESIIPYLRNKENGILHEKCQSVWTCQAVKLKLTPEEARFDWCFMRHMSIWYLLIKKTSMDCTPSKAWAVTTTESEVSLREMCHCEKVIFLRSLKI